MSRPRRRINISAGAAAPLAPRVPRSPANRTPVVSMFGLQVNTQLTTRNRDENQLREQLSETMNAFFDSDELLGSALNFHWEGDGMEQIREITVVGKSERGTSRNAIHGHYVVRLLHTTNLGFANTHNEYGRRGRPSVQQPRVSRLGTANPGYRPPGEPLLGEILAQTWNSLGFEPRLRNMNVLLWRINDPRSQIEYNLKELPEEERLRAMLAFEQANGRDIAERLAKFE